MGKFVKITVAVILMLLGVSACIPEVQEPTIEGSHNKYFDSRAQSRTFRVLTASGKPYNHRVDWFIDGIGAVDDERGGYLTQIVDTLPNGDMRIAYDWVTFIVKSHKSVITVEVAENRTGQMRSVYFVTSNSHQQLYSPNMTIVQWAE